MKGWKRLKQCGYTRICISNPHVLRELRQYCKEYRFLKSQHRIRILGKKQRFLMLKRARTMMKNGMWKKEKTMNSRKDGCNEKQGDGRKRPAMDGAGGRK